eukprot:scaffold482_cov266-Amphora_coffeaeformis.AAC.34
MAVTPQMDVPAVNSNVMWCGNPAARPARGINTRPAPTAPKTTGILAVPVAKTSNTLSLAATHTMPPWRTVLEAVVKPGLKVSSATPTVFFKVMPNKMDTGMPDRGTPKAVDKVEAAVNPTVATAAERPKPGKGEGGEEEEEEEENEGFWVVTSSFFFLSLSSGAWVAKPLCRSGIRGRARGDDLDQALVVGTRRALCTKVLAAGPDRRFHNMTARHSLVTLFGWQTSTKQKRERKREAFSMMMMNDAFDDHLPMIFQIHSLLMRREILGRNSVAQPYVTKNFSEYLHPIRLVLKIPDGGKRSKIQYPSCPPKTENGRRI